jgi:putative ATP-dependent endonuclease of OLD family
MAITKVRIRNFKIFRDWFELELNPCINILVGDNEAGKSTIIEAIHLALTGIINGKYLNTELTEYLFNRGTVKNYIDSLSTQTPQPPPKIVIELYFSEDCGLESFQGKINSTKDDAIGLSLIIAYDSKFNAEYDALVKQGDIRTLPIEYYSVQWITFADAFITPKSITVKSAFVDSSSAKYQNGSDVYISRIVRQQLDAEDVVKVAQAHRRMRDTFRDDVAIKAINEKLESASEISEKRVELSVELLSKNAWENSLTTYLDSIPFHYIGKGEQCVVKTKLALSDNKTEKASVVLIEEPENHLTHTRLNQLLDYIAKKCADKQIIISTHSSFVANKLNLSNLILLRNCRTIKLADLSTETQRFFEKLPGYDTLRLLLCDKAILVEGASDELVLQRAYMDESDGRMPIEDRIDIISVGTSFLRFLEISEKLQIPTVIVTDNDGNIQALEKKYVEYLSGSKYPWIYISYDKCDHTEGTLVNYNYNTLENLILTSNNLHLLNSILEKNYASEDKLRLHMRSKKADTALAIFSAEQRITIPDYIKGAISFVKE